MGMKSYRKKLGKKLQAVKDEHDQKRWNRNKKSRNNGEWIKPKK